MTTGARIAQKRKALGLSQEALGNQLGVSRQAIYKWESDSALPEIDKLIALSRLFAVSVGWLLGVEAPPPEDAQGTTPEAADGELTQAQLNMVEEIVARYTASLPKPHHRRWPFVLTGIVLTVIFLNLFQSLDTLRLQQKSIFNDLSRLESSMDNQIGSVTSRIEDILKAQNSLTADYSVELVPTASNAKENRAVFSAHVVPKTYTEGMTVEFSVDNGTGGVSYVSGEPAPDGGFTATLACQLTDSIAVSAIFETPDGTRSTQLLDQFDGLYSASLPTVDLMNYGIGDLLGLQADQSGLMTLPEVYITARSSSDGGKAPIGQSEAETIRVGLFKNQSLIVWLDPCEQPEHFHGEYDGESFYRLSEGTRTTLTTDTDQLQFAAVVTDQYGREAVYSDIPYVLSGGELTWPDSSDISDHDPVNWDYDG